MGRIRTFTRRAFVVGSVAVAGGVAFGVWQVLRVPENPLDPDAGATALNPWLIIDGDGVTVVTPRAEMGQGVYTTLAALVAEELDVDLADVRVAHGPPAQAYFNGALIQGREYDSTPPSGWSATLGQALPKIMAMQVTGGSTTTVDAFDKMRRAGAAARETLMRAAADRLDTGLDRLSTENGAVIAPDGSRIAYADLASAAAGIEPPSAPRLKERGEWRILGQSQPRKDQPGKATGTATYAIDTRLPGMLFASVRMSPRRAGMAGFDASAAEAMDGVKKVVDLGDGVAVIATNTWLAIQAVEAIDVTWIAPEYPAGTDAIFARIALAFDDKPNFAKRDDGDVDAALAGAETVIEAEYTAPYLAHTTMEPMNATALFTGDRLEIWAGSQAPVQVQRDGAKATGLDAEAVTVHTTYMGGGFGRRSTVDFATLAARVAQAMPGVAVQTTWSREEDMRLDHFRPGAIARFRAALDGGTPVAFEAKMAAPSIMAQQMQNLVGLNLAPADQSLTEGSHDQPYAIENMRVTGHSADVSIPVGFWRSVGNSQNAFFHESFVDELALAAGADPLAFRLNLIRPEHAASAGVLEAVREMSGWTGATPDGVGRGVAFTFSFGTPVAEVVEIRAEDGMIRIADMWIAADLGIALDPANCEAQLTSGAVYGLSAALHGQITFADGIAEQQNFPDYDALRMMNTPRFHVSVLETSGRISGVGEPGTPPAAPALANALYDLTGIRARRLPLMGQFDLLA